MSSFFIRFREDGEIVGSYLEIEDISLEDYGEYECRISNGVDDEMNLPAHIYRQGIMTLFIFLNSSSELLRLIN